MTIQLLILLISVTACTEEQNSIRGRWELDSHSVDGYPAHVARARGARAIEGYPTTTKNVIAEELHFTTSECGPDSFGWLRGRAYGDPRAQRASQEVCAIGMSGAGVRPGSAWVGTALGWRSS